MRRLPRFLTYPLAVTATLVALHVMSPLAPNEHAPASHYGSPMTASPGLAGRPADRSLTRPTGRLWGHVLVDSMAARAIVEVERVSGAAWRQAPLSTRDRPAAGANERLVVRAGPMGRFLTPPLPPGPYRVTAHAQGCSRSCSAVAAIPATGGDRELHLSIRIGKETLRGRVVREGGGSWKGKVLVSLTRRPAGQEDPPIDHARAHVECDDDGCFEIRGLPVGYAHVSTLGAEGVWTSHGDVWLPRATDLELRVGGELIALRGRILDDTGDAPVSQAVVVARSTGAYSVQSEARTTPDGTVRIWVPVSGASISVAARGYMSARVDLDVPHSPLLVRLARTATVRGRVVSNDSGDGVGGVRVVAVRDYMGMDGRWRGAEGWSDRDGNFLVEGVTPGRVLVFAYGAGWVSTGLQARTRRQFLIEIGRGETVVRDLVVSRGAIIGGRVADPAGRPVPGAAVCAEPQTTYVGDGLVPRVVSHADAEGRFRLVGLMDRTMYEVKASAPGFGDSPPRTALATSERPALLPIELRHLRRVLVTVVDMDGRPVQGADVVAASEPGLPFRVSANQLGRAQLVLPPGREYVIRACAPGLASREAALRLSRHVEADCTRVTVRMAPARAVKGRVTFSDGAAAPDVAVLLIMDDLTFRGSTSPSGEFEFRDVPEGVGRVLASHGEFDWARQEATAVVAAGEVRVRLRLPCQSPPPGEGDRTTVLVLDDLGRPVPRAKVRFRLKGEDGSEGNGVCRVVAGRAVLRAAHWYGLEVFGARSSSGVPLPLGPARFEGNPSHAQPIELELPPERTVSGVVRDGEGRPVRGASVTAIPLPAAGAPYGGHGSALAGEDGAFRIGQLGAGGYRLDTGPPPEFVLPEPAFVQAGERGVRINVHRGLDVEVLVTDPAGAPLSGVSVRALRWDERRLDGEARVARALTGRDGRATLVGLERQRPCRLSVVPPWGHHGALHEGRVLPNWMPKNTTIALELTRTVRGRVLDPSGTPVHGVRVELREIGSTRWRYANTSDRSGDFAFPAPGDAPVFVRASMGSPRTSSDLASGRFANDVGVRNSREVEWQPDAGPIELQIDSGVTIRVKIAGWPRTGAVHEATLVEEAEAGSETRAPISAQGEVEFHHAVPEAKYTLSVGPLPDGRVAYVRGLRGRSAPHQVVMEPGGVIRGRLRAPSDCGEVTLLLTGPGLHLEGRIENDGSYAIRGVPPGVWRVEARGVELAVTPEGGVRRVWRADERAAAGDTLDMELRERHPR